MQLLTDQDIKRGLNKPMIVALGSFDGVHYGHQVIIKDTIQQSRDRNALSGVFTFHPHPLNVVAPDKAPGIITALSQKKRILSQMGLDCLIIKAFTEEFARTGFQDFVETYLVKYLNVIGIVVGEDFHFGRNNMGNASALKELGNKYGFTVTVFDTIKVQGVEVRSTFVRQLIQKGEVNQLTTFLGRPFSMVGKVISGDGRGRKIGFPTANLKPVVEYVLPACGVYAVYVYLQDKKYPAVANIGMRPTFKKQDLSIEIHVMDYCGNLYDQLMEVEFIQRLRNELEFDSVEKLIKQVKNDVEKARQILSL